MAKKIIGILSIIFSIIIVWNGIKTENITVYFTGPLMLITGIFLIVYDLIYKKSFFEGFRANGTQHVILNVLVVVWIILFVIILIGLFNLMRMGAFSSLGIYWLSFLGILIPMIPCLAVFRIFDLNSKPYSMCKKYFLTNDEIAKQYLGNDSEFVKYSQNDFVFASGNGLLFRKSFCFIPFDRIVSIDSKSTIDGATVIFTFNNGKKLKMLTKQYDDIVAAMNSKNQ